MLEVIAACSEVVGVPIAFEVMPKREGDAAILVGDAQKASDVLGWKPEISELRDIISTTWKQMIR